MALITNVCRLCLVTEDLVWVFDRKMTGIQNISLKDIIFATSGVEIYPKDTISQKICTKCCKISMKMFQFREQSLKNDRLLKNQYAELLKNSKVKFKIPNTEITIATEKVEQLKDDLLISSNINFKIPNAGVITTTTEKVEKKKDELLTNSNINLKNPNAGVITPTTEKVEKKKEARDEISHAKLKIHPSVTNLFKENPRIRLPSVCLKSNIAPCVSLEMNAVEKYCRNQNLDMQKYSQLASKSRTSSRKVAKKKGSAKPITKPNISGVQEISSGSSQCLDPLRKGPRTSVRSAGSTRENATNPIQTRKYQEKILKTANVSKIVTQDSSKSSEDSDSSIRRNRLRHNKRKLSSGDSSTEQQPKKPTIIESLGLTPKMKLNGDSTGTLYLDKSVPLFICDICNSVQYNATDLKKHMLKHLRCQFCKMKFKSMDIKLSHIEKTCRIKNMMHNLPAIELEKVEFKLKVRRKYPESFTGFSPIPGLESEEENDSESYANEENPISVEPIHMSNINTENTVPESSDVIEILSDDEDSTPRLASEPSTVVSGIVTGSSETEPLMVFNKTPSATTKDTPVIHTRFPVAKTMEPPISIARNSPEPIIERNPVRTTPPINSVADMTKITSHAAVKPDIKIRNSSILDRLEPKAMDTSVVRYILNQSGLFHSVGNTQTFLPSNDTVNVNDINRTIGLTNMRHMLLVYKVPVHISKGNFKVSYKYERPVLPPKKFFSWNDLVAIDVKGTNVSASTTASLISNATTAANSLQSPSVSLPPNGTTITSDQSDSSIITVNADAGNDAIGTPISSEVSSAQAPSISCTPNSTNSVGPPALSVNTIDTNSGNVSDVTASFSGISYIQLPATPSEISVSDSSVFSISNTNTASPNISGPPTFVITSVAENAIIATPYFSDMSCIPPPSDSSIPNTPCVSGLSPFSDNSINAVAVNTTTDASISSGCFPTTTSVHQMSAPTSANTVCILSNALTNTQPDIYRNGDNSESVDIPSTAQDASPVSTSPTPINVPLIPASAALDDIPVLPMNDTCMQTVTEPSSVPIAGSIRVKNLCDLT